MLRISWEEGLSVFPRKVYKVVVIRVMSKRNAAAAALGSATAKRTEAQMEVAALIKAINAELNGEELIRTSDFEAAISDFGRQVKAKNGAGIIAAREAARKAAGLLAEPDDACDPAEVEDLAKILEQLNIEIDELGGDDGEESDFEGGGRGQTGGGVKKFLLDLRNAVLKCLGRCGRKVGAAGNYVGDFVIGLFDAESVAQRRAARDVLAAPSEDVLVQEGAVIAGELAVIGVTVGLSGAFDPLYEPLKALLFPMVYGAFVGIPSFVMALGRRLIAMGVVGCAGGALTLMGLLKLAIIRGTARGVVSAAGVGAAAVASAPDAILESFGVAAKASAYAVYKKLGGEKYKSALADAKAKFIAALKMSEADAPEAGAGAGAAAAAEAAAGAGAGAAAAALPAVAANEGVFERLAAAAPSGALSLAGKITRASKIAMSKVAGGTVDVVNGTRTLIGALAVGAMKIYYSDTTATIANVGDNLDGVFGDLDGARLAEIPEVREAEAAAEAVNANAGDEAAAVRAAAAAAPSANIPGDGAAAPMALEDADGAAVRAAAAADGAADGAAAAVAHEDEEHDEDEEATDEDDEEEMSAGPRAAQGGHRCPKCGSDMVDRALGLRKRKTRKAAPSKKGGKRRTTEKAPKKAAAKKGGKRRSTEKAPKKRSSYRKDRKLSRRR